MLIADDEALIAQGMKRAIDRLELFEVITVSNGLEAYDRIRSGGIDAMLLDINMPDMNGLELAGEIRRLHPQTAVIFITAFRQYALEAYAVHPSAYLLKPFDPMLLQQELEYALLSKQACRSSRICVRTFGHFEILLDGRALDFRRSKSKELLAYLVDRRGAGVTRHDAFATLWEDRQYDISMQKQLDVVIRSLRDTLQAYGIGSLFELRSRNLRVLPDMMDCDLYRFLDGDEKTVNAYCGEYMSQYTWARDTEAHLTRIQNSRLLLQQ
jgi:two-component SAPR family response regulator